MVIVSEVGYSTSKPFGAIGLISNNLALSLIIDLIPGSIINDVITSLRLVRTQILIS